MYSVGAMKDIFVCLLVLVAISEDGVLGEHRIKMEKGYNLQERPASEEEGGPLLIRLVGLSTINVLLYYISKNWQEYEKHFHSLWNFLY